MRGVCRGCNRLENDLDERSYCNESECHRRSRFDRMEQMLAEMPDSNLHVYDGMIVQRNKGFTGMDFLMELEP